MHLALVKLSYTPCLMIVVGLDGLQAPLATLCLN